MNKEKSDYKSERLIRILEKAKNLYLKKSELWCPYFSSYVTLNSEGFNHLLNKTNRIPRTMDEQILKLSLLGKALEVIKKSGTLQEYRNRVEGTGDRRADGFYKTSMVQYWSFDAIVGISHMIKITVTLKKTGDGKLIFWSVMPYGKLKNQKLYEGELEE